MFVLKENQLCKSVQKNSQSGTSTNFNIDTCMRPIGLSIPISLAVAKEVHNYYKMRRDFSVGFVVVKRAYGWIWSCHQVVTDLEQTIRSSPTTVVLKKCPTSSKEQHSSLALELALRKLWNVLSNNLLRQEFVSRLLSRQKTKSERAATKTLGVVGGQFVNKSIKQSYNHIGVNAKLN